MKEKVATETMKKLANPKVIGVVLLGAAEMVGGLILGSVGEKTIKNILGLGK